MNNFKTLREAQRFIQEAEDLLRGMRDQCDTPTQRTINLALGEFQPIVDAMVAVELSLERGKGV